MSPWRALSSDLALDTPWCRVRRDIVELPDGVVIDYFVSERPDVVVVLPITSGDQVVLVRQYKHAAGRETLELPAGTVDGGEDTRAAALRELREETGWSEPRSVIDLGAVDQDTSRDTNRVHSFVAEGLSQSGDQQLDGNEAAGGVVAELHPRHQLLDLITTGQITAQSSVVTILKSLVDA